MFFDATDGRDATMEAFSGAGLFDLGLGDFKPAELLPDLRPTVRFKQVLELDALVHVEDSLLVALCVGQLLRMLLHLCDLDVPLCQYLVSQVEL